MKYCGTGMEIEQLDSEPCDDHDNDPTFEPQDYSSFDCDHMKNDNAIESYRHSVHMELCLIIRHHLSSDLRLISVRVTM